MADDPRAADGPAARQGASDRAGTPPAVRGHDADPYGPADAAARRSHRTACLSRFLWRERRADRRVEDDIVRLLVLAQAEEDGVAEPAIWCPFGEAHFRHQLRLDPMKPPWHCGGDLGGRSGVDRQLFQSASQIAKNRATEARAHATGIAEVSFERRNSPTIVSQSPRGCRRDRSSR